MTTPTQYRECALDCLKWAEEATNESQKKTFVHLARLWMEAAMPVLREGRMVGHIAIEPEAHNHRHARFR